MQAMGKRERPYAQLHQDGPSYAFLFASGLMLVLLIQSETRIRLNDTKRGVTTTWSLEKFESRLLQMRELYQQRGEDSDGASGEEDPFNDAEDKWEKDFKLDSPASR